MGKVKVELTDTIDRYKWARNIKEKTSLEISEAQLPSYDKWILKTKVDKESHKIEESYIFLLVLWINEYINLHLHEI